ncbi:MAG: hypothetical protein ACKO4K_03845 [Flavobacteriales bacterium]
MKSIALSAFVLASLVLASCKPSLCDCKKMAEDNNKEFLAAKSDADKKKVEENRKTKLKPCEDLIKNKSKEEQDKLIQEWLKCK